MVNSAGPCSRVAWSATRPACPAGKAPDAGSAAGEESDGVAAMAVLTTRPCTSITGEAPAVPVPVPIMTRPTAPAAPPVRARERDRGRGAPYRVSVSGPARRLRTFRDLILVDPPAKGILVRSAHSRVRS